jgi:selT/selW/selH-like putative selenoprotein
VIKAKRGIDPELIEGHGGVFEVRVNGKLVFSKLTAGRFPEPDEILGAIPA